MSVALFSCPWVVVPSSIHTIGTRRKKAPIMSCPVSHWISVPCTRSIREMTFRGIAFSCTSFGSMLLYAWYCFARFQSRIPSWSRVGFGCPWLRKAAATLLRVFLTVPVARGASHGCKNLPSRTATAKQLNMFICFLWGLWERCPLWVLYYCSTCSIISMPERGHCVCFAVPLLHGQFLQQRGQPRDNFAG